MSEKTIALSGAEVKVTFSGGNAWLRNDGASAVYAAKTAGVTAGADGVVSIPAGGSAPVYGANGTVFLLGSGSVQLIGSDYATNPFACDSSGGGAGTSTNAAGIVTLDGLQGGVPFSDITLSGDDIIGQEITLSACGKNLIPYPYAKTTETINGVTFTDNGNGTITAGGTATATIWYTIASGIKIVKGTTYNFSCGTPVTGGGTPISGGGYIAYVSLYADKDSTVTSQYAFPPKNTDNIVFTANYEYANVTIRIDSGSTVENVVFRPQLEIGTVSTPYESYSGSTITVTPDSNPYTVPDDIRQRDGRNTVSVSAGEVSVTGAKRNAALKRIWDKLDELTAAIIVSNGEI